MKCMLLMYADPDETKAMSRADRDIVARKHDAIVAELTESGELVDGAGLDYPWTTTTLRWGADPVAVDGPCLGPGNSSPPTTSSTARAGSERSRWRIGCLTFTSPLLRCEASTPRDLLRDRRRSAAVHGLNDRASLRRYRTFDLRAQ